MPARHKSTIPGTIDQQPSVYGQGGLEGMELPFLDVSDKEIGTITKKWAGIKKELFTSADNYIISLNQEPNPEKAMLLLAAGLAVDTIYKE
jgi:hypothetical protein